MGIVAFGHVGGWCKSLLDNRLLALNVNCNVSKLPWGNGESWTLTVAFGREREEENEKGRKVEKHMKSSSRHCRIFDPQVEPMPLSYQVGGAESDWIDPCCLSGLG